MSEPNNPVIPHLFIFTWRLNCDFLHIQTPGKCNHQTVEIKMYMNLQSNCNNHLHREREKERVKKIDNNQLDTFVYIH